MLFDSHTHLDDRKFDSDRDEVIKEILESGVHMHLMPVRIWTAQGVQ